VKVSHLLFSNLCIDTREKIDIVHKTIKLHSPNNIVFVGDTVNLLDTKTNLRYLNELRYYDNAIFLEGDRDSHTNGLRNLRLRVMDRSIFVLHGDIFGSCVSRSMVKISEWSNQKIQEWITFHREGRDWYPPLYWQRNKLLKRFDNGKYDLVISGHTHYEEHTVFDDFEYVNLGNWDWYGLLFEDGSIELRSMNGYGEHTSR